MKYEIINVDNVEIYIYKDKKYNTIKINTLLINELSYDNFTKEKLLNNYLSRSINDYKDELSLTKRFLELYDPRIRVSDYYSYNHIKSFDLNMLNEKYTEKGMLKDTINLYYSFIFNPNVVNNKFDKQNLDLSKNSLKLFYKAMKEDPGYNALNNAFSLIDEKIPIKYNTDGNENEVDNISEKDLYDFYIDELNKSQIKVFITGDVNDDIIDLIKDSIKVNNSNKYTFDSFVHKDKVKEVIEKKETEHLNQSKLIYIYKILNITKREKEYISILYNTILGGNNSKLFRNVREKESLCYSIYSNINPLMSYMFIMAGISKENYIKTKNSIEKQINEIKNGNITDEELNEAKETIITGLLSRNDYQFTIINNLINKSLYNMEFDSKKIISEFKSITKEEIIEFSKKLDLNVIYLLEGDK